MPRSHVKSGTCLSRSRGLNAASRGGGSVTASESCGPSADVTVMAITPSWLRSVGSGLRFVEARLDDLGEH